jgi:hypothetical protein
MRKSKILLLLPIFIAALSTRAAQTTVVVPVAAFALGANGAMWATEMRVTNLSAQAATFRVVDFVGRTADVPFQAQEFQVSPGATQSYGGWNLISPWLGAILNDPSGPYFGAVVLALDDGLMVQTAVLSGNAFNPYTGPSTGSSFGTCPAFAGGYTTLSYFLVSPGICNEGAGPLVDGTSDFYPPGATIFLPWLHSDATRRTNLTFYNPDPAPAEVTVVITPADGTRPVSETIGVPAHDVLQINDVFAIPPFNAVRAHNLPQNTAAARAAIQSTTRLFAVAWVVSDQNNTVTISLPR